MKERRKKDRVVSLRGSLARRVEAFTRRYGAPGRGTNDVVETLVESALMVSHRQPRK